MAWSAATWIGVISSTRSSPCDHSINKKAKALDRKTQSLFVCVKR